MEIVFTGYFFIIILLFISLRYRVEDRVDLQIDAESILMDCKPTSRKTCKKRLYEASGLNIEPYHKKPKMVKTTLLSLINEKRIP